MNLRILKKLSKRAAPLLSLLGDDRQQFLSEAGDNYHGLRILARKHWDRSHCHPSYNGASCYEDEIVYTTRAGHRLVMRSPHHPRPRTVMVGAMTGYYEPEWDEESAYGALRTAVIYNFADYDEHEMRPTRRLATPRDIFAAAGEMIAERRAA